MRGGQAAHNGVESGTLRRAKFNFLTSNVPSVTTMFAKRKLRNELFCNYSKFPRPSSARGVAGGSKGNSFCRAVSHRSEFLEKQSETGEERWNSDSRDRLW